MSTNAGTIYVVKGGVPHAVSAITDHMILACGAPHKPVDSEGSFVGTSAIFAATHGRRFGVQVSCVDPWQARYCRQPWKSVGGDAWLQFRRNVHNATATKAWWVEYDR